MPINNLFSVFLWIVLYNINKLNSLVKNGVVRAQEVNNAFKL